MKSVLHIQKNCIELIHGAKTIENTPFDDNKCIFFFTLVEVESQARLKDGRQHKMKIFHVERTITYQNLEVQSCRILCMKFWETCKAFIRLFLQISTYCCGGDDFSNLTLKNDQKIFTEHCIPGAVPEDFKLFRKLCTKRERRLISPLPGYCTHGMTQFFHL